MPDIKSNKKIQKAFGEGSVLDKLNQMEPAEALAEGLGFNADKRRELQKSILNKISTQNKPVIPFNPRTQEEDLRLKQKGMDTFQNIKDDEARKQVDMLKQGIDMLEAEKAMGNPDAIKQIEMKKALLKRYGY